MKITKAMLLQELAQELPEYHKSDLRLIVNTFLKTVMDDVADGNDVEVYGFGKFSRVMRQARLVHMPNGMKVQTQDHYAPTFVPSLPFRQLTESSAWMPDDDELKQN